MQSISGYLATLHPECLDAAGKFRFDKTHPWHFSLVALYGSALELTGCVIVLSRHDGYVGLGSIVRTLLETYIDLVNLADDRSYGRYMDAADAKQMRTILRRAAEIPNLCLTGVRDHKIFEQQITQLDKELRDLESDGITPLNIEERFTRAGALELYDCVYRLLCIDTHSNRSALLDRHLERLGGGDFAIAFYLPRTERDLLPFLDSTADMLVYSTRRIHEALEIELPSGLAAQLDRFADIRKSYSKFWPSAGA